MKIASNTCTNNGYGSIFDTINGGGGSFWFDDSNNGYGIQIFHSNNNLIYLNNYINNANNADYFGLAKNAWNSTKEITYTYNEKKHTNFMGNYWDDYNVSDADNDGIGDTSYNLDGCMDNYPLMQPWESYFLEENRTRTNTKNETQKFTFSSYTLSANRHRTRRRHGSTLRISVKDGGIPIFVTSDTLHHLYPIQCTGILDFLWR